MATTTNYSWATPDDTDLVKDGAAAIRTLGSSADTTVKNLNPGTTAGDIDYYTSGTAKARIGIGTAGQVLQVNAGATAPEWATFAGGGKVLQVVQGTYSTSISSTSTSFADTGITASITPSAATSKVLVIVSQLGYGKSGGGDTKVQTKLFRGATEIAVISGSAAYNNTNAPLQLGTLGIAYLDSPSTTSATTYKTQYRTTTGSAVYGQDGAETSTIILMEIGA